MLKEIAVDFGELVAYEGLIVGWRLDWDDLRLFIELRGCWLSPERMAVFAANADQDDFSATLTFGGVASLRIGSNALHDHFLPDQGAAVYGLEEFPFAILNPQPSLEETGWMSGRIRYGTVESQNVLAPAEVPIRCFAMRASGVNAEWTATSVSVLFRGPIAQSAR